MEIHKNIRCKLGTFLIGGILVAFGLSGAAFASCLPDPDANGALIVDATTECANLGQNGCQIPGESGSCTFTGPLGDTTVTATKGPEGGITWTSSGVYSMNWILVGGATQGGACAYNYLNATSSGAGAVLGNEKSNGTISKVSYVYGCSKEEPPEAKLTLKKTASLSGDCADSAKSQEFIIDNVPPEGEAVTYCYEICNVGTAEATAVSIQDDNGGVVASWDTDIGTIPAGSCVDLENTVNISSPGAVQNTATVEGYSDSALLTATDTATVTGTIAPEACPEDYQQAINDLAIALEEDGFNNATLFDVRHPSRTAVCVPTCPPGSEGNCEIKQANRVKCVNECVVRPECDLDPSALGCEQPCTPTGRWTDNSSGQCLTPELTANNPPQCWEVEQDLNRDCVLNDSSPMSTKLIMIKQGKTNPYWYEQCNISGGRSLCEIICYPYYAGDEANCPPNSTIR